MAVNHLGQKVNMRKIQATNEFEELYAETIASGDKPAIRMAWNVYKDGLYKGGRISDSQANNWMNPIQSARQE